MMKRQLVFILAGLLLLLSACGDPYKAIEPNMDEKVADFNFTTQDNESFSLDDLKGTWWIADFIFTNCTSVCLPMSTNMSALQDKLKENDIDVQLVSFTVDPDYDQPEILREYAEEYDADLTNWTFLTGYDFQTIRELSIKSFRSPLPVPERNTDQVMHGTAFMLVTPEGQIIKSYDGVSPSEIDIIIDDLNTIEKMNKGG